MQFKSQTVYTKKILVNQLVKQFNDIKCGVEANLYQILVRPRSNYAGIPPRLERENFSISPTACTTAAMQNKYPETPSAVYKHPK